MIETAQLPAFKVVQCFGYPTPEVMLAEHYEEEKDFVREVIWSGSASDASAAFMAAMEIWRK